MDGLTASITEVSASGRELGHKVRRFVFTYEDIAQAAGCSVQACRMAVFKGYLDPTRMDCLVDWVAARRILGQTVLPHM